MAVWGQVWKILLVLHIHVFLSLKSWQLANEKRLAVRRRRRSKGCDAAMRFSSSGFTYFVAGVKEPGD